MYNIKNINKNIKYKRTPLIKHTDNAVGSGFFLLKKGR